jgi:hypothetical protein
MNAFGAIYILLLVPESFSLESVKVPPSDLPQKHRHRVTRSKHSLELLQRLNPLRIISGLVPAEVTIALLEMNGSLNKAQN